MPIGEPVITTVYLAGVAGFPYASSRVYLLVTKRSTRDRTGSSPRKIMPCAIES